jgi:hypothetical protein
VVERRDLHKIRPRRSDKMDDSRHMTGLIYAEGGLMREASVRYRWIDVRVL